MKLSEKKIEDIIYGSPWLVDSNFIVPKIMGASNEYGRQVNVGKDKNRYIDLLLKDTKDNRPVIIEIKKGKLVRENVAQILEYKALIVSLPEKQLHHWRDEFDSNYYAPKLILVGTEADDEVVLSANLAGIQIRTLTGLEKVELKFNSIGEIDTKLKEWSEFIDSGNRTLIERSEWLETIIEKVNNIIESIDSYDLESIKEVPSISSKRAYFGQEFPFLNLPIYYKDKGLIGFYEYFGEGTPYSDKYFYCDLAFLDEMEFHDDTDEKVEKILLKILKSKKYNFNEIDEDWPVIKLNRNLLDDAAGLKKTLIKLIKDSIEILGKLKPYSTKAK